MNEDSLKLTSYFGERQRTADNGFAADALLDLYGQRGIATSILLRGVEGFGARQRLRTDRSLTLSDDLPLTAVAVDTRSRIEGLLESTSGLLRSGLALSSSQYLLLGTAAVGSYTTFSTWMLETQRLTEERQHRKAVLNIVVSLALGIAAAALGRLIGMHL